MRGFDKNYSPDPRKDYFVIIFANEGEDGIPQQSGCITNIIQKGRPKRHVLHGDRIEFFDENNPIKEEYKHKVIMLDDIYLVFALTYLPHPYDICHDLYDKRKHTINRIKTIVRAFPDDQSDLT